MQISHSATYANQPLHDWLRSVKVAYVPGQTTSLLKEVVTNLLDRFKLRGHDVQNTPDDATDVLLTTAPFGESLDWREAMADDYALESTGKSEAFMSAFTRLANQNLGELDPEQWVVWFFHSHPAIWRRIRAAEAFKQKA